jgi:hypothetical protein
MVLGCTELEKLWIVYNPFGVRPYDAAHPDLVRPLSPGRTASPNRRFFDRFERYHVWCQICHGYMS